MAEDLGEQPEIMEEEDADWVVEDEVGVDDSVSDAEDQAEEEIAPAPPVPQKCCPCPWNSKCTRCACSKAGGCRPNCTSRNCSSKVIPVVSKPEVVPPIKQEVLTPAKPIAVSSLKTEVVTPAKDGNQGEQVAVKEEPPQTPVKGTVDTGNGEKVVVQSGAVKETMTTSSAPKAATTTGPAAKTPATAAAPVAKKAAAVKKAATASGSVAKKAATPSAAKKPASADKKGSAVKGAAKPGAKATTKDAKQTTAADPAKKKVPDFVPSKQDFTVDLVQDEASKTLSIGPISLVDLGANELFEVIKKGEQFTVNFMDRKNAYIYVRYNTVEEMMKCVTAMKSYKIPVKPLYKEGDNVSSRELFKVLISDPASPHVRRLDIEVPENIVAIPGVPLDITEKELAAEIPDAVSFFIPKQDNKAKGYAYVEVKDASKKIGKTLDLLKRETPHPFEFEIVEVEKIIPKLPKTLRIAESLWNVDVKGMSAASKLKHRRNIGYCISALSKFDKMAKTTRNTPIIKKWIKSLKAKWRFLHRGLVSSKGRQGRLDYPISPPAWMESSPRGGKTAKKGKPGRSVAQVRADKIRERTMSVRKKPGVPVERQTRQPVKKQVKRGALRGRPRGIGSIPSLMDPQQQYNTMPHRSRGMSESYNETPAIYDNTDQSFVPVRSHPGPGSGMGGPSRQRQHSADRASHDQLDMNRRGDQRQRSPRQRGQGRAQRMEFQSFGGSPTRSRPLPSYRDPYDEHQEEQRSYGREPDVGRIWSAGSGIAQSQGYEDAGFRDASQYDDQIYQAGNRRQAQSWTDDRASPEYDESIWSSGRHNGRRPAGPQYSKQAVSQYDDQRGMGSQYSGRRSPSPQYERRQRSPQYERQPSSMYDERRPAARYSEKRSHSPDYPDARYSQQSAYDDVREPEPRVVSRRQPSPEHSYQRAPGYASFNTHQSEAPERYEEYPISQSSSYEEYSQPAPAPQKRSNYEERNARYAAAFGDYQGGYADEHRTSQPKVYGQNDFYQPMQGAKRKMGQAPVSKRRRVDEGGSNSAVNAGTAMNLLLGLSNLISGNLNTNLSRDGQNRGGPSGYRGGYR